MIVRQSTRALLYVSMPAALVGLLWFIAWFFFAHESPTTHPTITPSEATYIKREQGETACVFKVKSETYPARICAIPYFVISCMNVPSERVCSVACNRDVMACSSVERLQLRAQLRIFLPVDERASVPERVQLQHR